MKSVSIEELKQHLSELIREAGGGEPILITRHRKPVAILSAAEHRHLHVGRRHGTGRLVPAPVAGTHGRFLEVLAEDRRGTHER